MLFLCVAGKQPLVNYCPVTRTVILAACRMQVRKHRDMYWLIMVMPVAVGGQNQKCKMFLPSSRVLCMLTVHDKETKNDPFSVPQDRFGTPLTHISDHREREKKRGQGESTDICELIKYPTKVVCWLHNEANLHLSWLALLGWLVHCQPMAWILFLYILVQWKTAIVELHTWHTAADFCTPQNIKFCSLLHTHCT